MDQKKNTNGVGILIRQRLIERGTTQTDIARSLGVTPQAIYLVVEGKRRTPRIREAIARAIDMAVEEIWPEDPCAFCKKCREEVRTSA